MQDVAQCLKRLERLDEANGVCDALGTLFDDERAIAILGNCAAAIRGKGGKVLLVELIIVPGNEPGLAKWIDLEMLAMAGGRERTEGEYVELFSKAGLRLARVVRAPSPFCVIEAVKA